jgi:formaldehyde-activating enzyme
VQALKGVSLEIKPGEIHGLLGENGAGKSTLIKIVAGAYTPDQGEMTFDGAPARWSSPREAKRHGVHVVYQEFVLFPQLSVAENIFVGHELRNRFGIVDHARMRREASQLLQRLGVSLDPRASVGTLSVADQQMVEIARAMVHRVKLLVLDEPTAVIAGQEVTLLFDRLRRLRDSGVSVIFISHRLEEVFAICDRVTVLKDGELVGTHDVAGVSRERLISMMVGRELSDLFPPKRAAAAAPRPVLRTENLSVAGRVRDVSIELRSGEIVALAGMVVAGRTELALGLFGALPISGGAVEVDGHRHHPGDRDARVQRAKLSLLRWQNEAFANSLVNQKEGHTNLLAVVTPNLPCKPDTIIANKVTMKGATQAVQMFGPAQAAVARAVVDSVSSGVIPKAKADDYVILVGVFIHWEAADDKKIFQFNYEATKQSIERALKGKPTVDEVLTGAKTATHPFAGGADK